MKALFIWDVRDELRTYLQDGLSALNKVEMVFPDEADEKTYLKHAVDAEIIVGWRPTEELLEKAVKLKLFINPGAGVQHLIEKFRNLDQTRNVRLVNGHGNSYFTAQHTVGMLLTLMNKIIPHHNWMKNGKWRLGDKEGASIPLRELNIGLLGYGAVNSKLHRFLRGFDLQFGALRLNPAKFNDVDGKSMKIFRHDELHDFLRFSNILIISVPQTELTKGMIGKMELQLLGEDGILVNVGRGDVVNEAALYKALINQSIRGAAIDVWYEYNPDEDDAGRKYPYDYPFHELENVVLSPHRAASPFSDLKRWDEVIENIRRCHAGRTDFLNLVDTEAGY